MEISRSAVVIVAAGCVIAGAAGGYIATRPGTGTPSAASTQSPPIGFEEVEHSETIVSDDVRAVAAPAKPAARAQAPARPAPVPTPAPAQPHVSTPHPPPSLEHPDVAEPSGPATEIVAIAPPPIETARSSETAPQPAIEPSGPDLEELVIAGDSVIGLQIETAVSSETARIEDKVTARVTRDVKVGDKVAIPAGSKAQGEVTLVERGGKLRERARLGVRFTSIVLADGTRLPINTEPIYRDGDSPGRESAAKIGGGAIAGTIIGGLLGGAKGAAIGGAIGGGAGSTAVMAGGRNPATLTPGSPITVRLQQPATVTVER